MCLTNITSVLFVFVISFHVCVYVLFLLFEAATQLACQVHQERTQMVCSNKVDWSRLALRHVELGFLNPLRVEFLLKTDSGYPKDTGVNKPWQPMGIPFAITPIGQLHQSPPSPIPGDLGRGPSHQSGDMLEHRDTYGQA